MVDGLDGLGHHAVVCSYYKNGDICGLGAAHTHGCERLMSRCIQEGDLLAVLLNHIGADMLGDSSGLLCRHIRLADGIEKGGLSVVNVSHNTYNRRTLHHILLVLLILSEELLDHIDLFLLLAEDVKFHGDLFSLVVINLLVDGDNGSLKEQLLYNHGRLHLHLLSQLLDGDNLRQNNGLYFLCLRLFLLLRHDEGSLSGLSSSARLCAKLLLAVRPAVLVVLVIVLIVVLALLCILLLLNNRSVKGWLRDA